MSICILYDVIHFEVWNKSNQSLSAHLQNHDSKYQVGFLINDSDGLCIDGKRLLASQFKTIGLYRDFYIKVLGQ
jgi:hypothetical protein